MKCRYLLVCLSFISGCAMGGRESRPMEAPEIDYQEVESSRQAMQRMEKELFDSLQAGQTIDCARVCSLAGNLCKLAGKICIISRRHPESPELTSSCRDGTRRCDRARTRVKSRCQCSEIDIPHNPGEISPDH
ncbi:MAG TPA: hypothetical protein VM425_01970 [Myxococcota bacterium]|nr:hypothetical protein [Myxococcota bacterium]